MSATLFRCKTSKALNDLAGNRFRSFDRLSGSRSSSFSRILKSFFRLKVSAMQLLTFNEALCLDELFGIGPMERRSSMTVFEITALDSPNGSSLLPNSYQTLSREPLTELSWSIIFRWFQIISDDCRAAFKMQLIGGHLGTHLQLHSAFPKKFTSEESSAFLNLLQCCSVFVVF